MFDPNPISILKQSGCQNMTFFADEKTASHFEQTGNLFLRVSTRVLLRVQQQILYLEYLLDSSLKEGMKNSEVNKETTRQEKRKNKKYRRDRPCD